MDILQQVLEFTKTQENYKFYIENDSLFPKKEQIFKALEICKTPKVVIFGQDPYPRLTSACGISFFDAEIKNFSDKHRRSSIDVIIESLCIEKGININQLPSCEQWFQKTSQQGVLWLNTSLTYNPQCPKPTHKKFWMPVIKKIISLLPKDCVYVLMGGDAQSIPLSADAIRINLQHPSPMNSSFKMENFKMFTKINQYVNIEW